MDEAAQEDLGVQVGEPPRRRAEGSVERDCFVRRESREVVAVDVGRERKQIGVRQLRA